MISFLQYLFDLSYISKYMNEITPIVSLIIPCNMLKEIIPKVFVILFKISVCCLYIRQCFIFSVDKG